MLRRTESTLPPDSNSSKISYCLHDHLYGYELIKMKKFLVFKTTPVTPSLYSIRAMEEKTSSAS